MESIADFPESQDAYIYRADLHCSKCGEKIREDLTAKGEAPEEPEDEYTYDSDDFPKGPYPDGGGEADCPQHCGTCGCFLGNPLTGDGEEYVREVLREAKEDGKPLSPIEEMWAKFYKIDAEDCDD